jgi:glycosyltransferase involved in cell wall biosynthesis
MKIAFVTTQSFQQSTLIGRVLPLAKEFAKEHTVTLLVHGEGDTPDVPSGISSYVTGPNPFARTTEGKKRKRGFSLIWTMKKNALRAAWRLIQEKPDCIIIVKPLPENVLAVRLATLFLRRTKIILDVDDFELMANTLSSLVQRAAIHWSERVASHMAQHIIVATPFLEDHMKLLSQNTTPVTLIPTGLSLSSAPTYSSDPTILFAGSLSLSSGHRVDLLPEILSHVQKRVPHARLIISGSGDDEQSLRREFQQQGLESSVKWTGRFSPTTIQDIATRASMLIDPIDSSIANRAKSSFRVALALSMGMPIVTSNVGIRTQLIPDQFHESWFAAPGDAQSYAEKIAAILTHPLSEHEKHLLQQKSKQYEWDALAKMYYACIV